MTEIGTGASEDQPDVSSKRTGATPLPGRNQSTQQPPQERDMRAALLLGAVTLGLLGFTIFAANQAYLSGHISQLAGDAIQYTTICLFGVLLVLMAYHIVGDRLVTNILWAGMFFIVISSVLNVTNDARVLDAWPLLGNDSPLNDPVKEAAELLAIVMTLTALVAAILSLRKMRDDLVVKHEQLLGEVARREQLEAKQVEIEHQFRQAQKLEAVGQLTGGVAHDFNNLLQVITGYAGIAIDNPQDQKLTSTALNEIASAGERATRLISQLLTFSRRQVMRPESIDLNQTVAHLLKLVERVIGEHIQLEWRPGENVGAILADRGMIEQALMNLCVNARDAMRDGGSLSIATQEILYTDDYPTAHQPWAEPGRYALLSVSDTGCGMSKEVLEHVFEPFFTTKAPGSGTGLGLATVYGIVKQHAGLIHVESEPGKGTTFNLYWPVSETAAEPEESRSPESITHRGTNGAEALALFHARGNDFAMAILDVVMPEMGGREVYERIRKARPDFKVIFVSGYSNDGIHTNFVIDAGLNLIQKPYSEAVLLRAVRDALDNSSA
ncbi:MAG: response regulator [Candidatus Hydrogenedentes bacterium]|nr:response regulator [Candidatus Hydrogenedentota bacterium]